MIRASPAISSALSPFIRRAVANAAICDGVASPSTMSSMAAAASVSRSERPSTTLTIISLIAIRLPPSRSGRRHRDRLAGRVGIRLIYDVQEVLEQDLAAVGQDRLGVELDSEEGLILVADAHHEAVRGLRVHDQDVGQGLAVGDQRVVPDRLKLGLHVCVEAGAVVVDERGLAVQELGCADDLGAVARGDGLVTEANAQDRLAADEAVDDRDADTGVLGSTGPGREDDP